MLGVFPREGVIYLSLGGREIGLYLSSFVTIVAYVTKQIENFIQV